MKVSAHLLFVGLTLAASAQAEVAVYQDQQLELPSAVVMTKTGPVYYGDVRLAANADGSLKLMEAQRRNLAEVKALTVAVDQNFFPPQATVTANGALTIACVALEEPGVARQGNTFYVVLAETPLDPLALCLPVVAETTFSVQVPLDLSGLEAGQYRVIANGVETSFVLNGENL